MLGLNISMGLGFGFGFGFGINMIRQIQKSLENRGLKTLMKRM